MWADSERKKNKKKKAKAKKLGIAGLSEKAADSESDGQDMDDSDSDDEQDGHASATSMQQTTGNFLKPVNSGARGSLPKTNIDIKQCSDANKEEPHQVGPVLMLLDFFGSLPFTLSLPLLQPRRVLNRSSSIRQLESSSRPE